MARGSAKKAAARARACTPPMGGSVIPDVDDVAPVLHCGSRVSNLPSAQMYPPNSGTNGIYGKVLIKDQ